jgi:hypothetical protein
MVKGISGAPCLIGGDVRALIQRALLVEKIELVAGEPTKVWRAQDGTLFAIGLRAIVERLGSLDEVQWDDLAPLPFEEHVHDAFGSLFTHVRPLRRLAPSFGVPEQAVADDHLAEKLARAALKRPNAFETYLALKSSADRPDAEHGAAVVRCVAAASVDGARATLVRDGLLRTASVAGVALCTAHPTVARLFLWRARYGEARLAPWNGQILDVPVESIESPEAEAAQAEADVRAYLRRACANSDLAFWLRTTVFVVVLSGMSNPEAVIARLAAAPDLRKGCFVALVGEAPPEGDHARWARLRVVTSGMSADVEAELHNCCHETENGLTDWSHGERTT